jgi:hypothetical protein
VLQGAFTLWNCQDEGEVTAELQRIEAPVETFGVGARGFNVYDGQLREASFASITTHADAGVGIQVSRHVERLRVDGDVRTSGGVGKSLVKGRVVPLPAYAVSIQNSGDVAELSIGGSLITEGVRDAPQVLTLTGTRP